MPSGLNEGRNLSAGRGEGVANVWSFEPAIRYAQNLYAQDENRRRLAAKQMDDIMKEYDPKRAKLRSSDVPAYVDMYNQFKQLNQIKLSGKVKNPVELATLDKEINKIGGSMQQWVSKSAQQAEFESKLAEDNLRRFDDYGEGTPTIIASMRQTPVDKIENNELVGLGNTGFNVRDISAYLAPQFDTRKIEKWSQSRRKPIPETELLPDGKYRDVYRTELALQPNQIIEDAHNKFLSDKSAAREFKKTFSKDTQDGTYQIVLEQFEKNYPDVASKIKVVDPATYYAVRHLASFKPEVTYGEPKFTDAKKFENQKTIQAIGFANAKKLAEMRRDWKLEDDETSAIWVDEYINNNLIPETDLGGKYNFATIKIETDDPTVNKALGNPDQIVYNTKTGEWETTYYKKNREGEYVGVDGEITDKPIINDKMPKKLNREQMKLAIRAAAPKDIQTVREMKKDPNAAGKTRKVTGSVEVIPSFLKK